MWWKKKASCPVRSVEQLWIEENLDWFVAEFGDELLRRPVVVPEESWFPAGYSGSEDDVRAVFRKLCDHVEVPADRVRLDLEPDEPDELVANLGLNSESSGAAGHWRQRDGATIVTVDMKQAQRPVALVATMVHELGHERLLGEDRIDPDRRDGEPLTDLFTVFVGFGIFSANASFEFYRTHTHYGTSKLGYLTEAMYGYALARYAWLRGETEPAWAERLDTNPREWMKQGLRFLEAGVG
ncbi:hypothetical protein E0H73_04640 [Kribbella pittospori]|uniref:Uncharacterized protein n=1 Tax=Kribbella pittospori TaxID=722689 RepID=A0A4R0L0U3_9ACTN|nr:hypothetical protein [Kribbella pittospori]TCC66197.1 hypothetical protein E0H73_04640 [Kribbella pittospori]